VITVAKANVDKGLTDFKQPLVGVLRLLGLPLIKLASSDDLRSIHNLCDVVCAMGQCTECTDGEVGTEAAKSLVTFSNMTRIHTLGEEAGETFLQSSFTQRIIERSQVIPILVAILRDSLENPQATSAITSTLKSFSTFASNARQIIASGASELLVTVLTNDFNVPAVHTAIEVLWNCLENENSAKTVLASWHTLVRDLLYPYTCALRSRSLLSVSVCTTLLAVSITLCCRSLLSVCSFGVGDRTHSRSC
jgi:hypothetical protein